MIKKYSIKMYTSEKYVQYQKYLCMKNQFKNFCQVVLYTNRLIYSNGKLNDILL